MVAAQGHDVIGFVAAYRLPDKPKVVFVWQIGVSETARGKGLGTEMLLSLLQRESCRDVSFLEATVTPSNLPSMRLFQSLARRLQTQISEHDCFETQHFPDGGHEPERLVRLGPFDLSKSKQGSE